MSLEVKLLNRNRPLAYTLKEDDDGDDYKNYFWASSGF
jgi:hypothetical protein